MKNKGFTLIEMITVIVILGILAVTAAPKFLDIQSDARNAVLKNVAGIIMSSVDTAYGKMAIDGLEGYEYVTNQFSSDKNSVQASLPFPGCEKNGHSYCVFRYGYPDADPLTIAHLVNGIYDGTKKDYDFVSIYGHDGDEDSSFITFKNNVVGTSEENDKLKEMRCYIKYTPAKALGEHPTTTVIPC